MLRNPLSWLLALIGATALAACCGSVACDCKDALDNAVQFRFNLADSTAAPARGFRAAEVDSVYLTRSLLRDTARRPVIDTVLLVRLRREAANPVTLNTSQPFAQRGTLPIDTFRYQLYLGRRRNPTVLYKIDRLKVRNKLEANGCCTCNRNVSKLLYLDGAPTPLDLTDPTGRDEPVPVTLNRK